MSGKTYIAIDLKSFYASVECMQRGLDPLDTNLVVADESRTDKTICLAVSPSMKSYGLPGRCRLFEVRQKITEVNRKRLAVNKKDFVAKTYRNSVLRSHNEYALDCVIAPPQMSRYMEISTKIYSIYLQYVSSEDIHVYSIDEVFIDVTPYLKLYKTDARSLAQKMISHVLKETGITATCGIGTNLYLAKVAMDIEAKHIEADSNGVRIAELDEMSYRKKLWCHEPLTDFWRVGRGISKRLNKLGIKTMGDIAKVSVANLNCAINEETLYKEFGVNAELLIDHAWGHEPCTIKEIKSYKPKGNSLGRGQVLQSPYTFEKARIVVREMAETLSLVLVQKKILAKQIFLLIGYDTESQLEEKDIEKCETDFYGRLIPKPAHGIFNFTKPTSSTHTFAEIFEKIFDQCVNRKYLVRRINVSASAIISEKEYSKTEHYIPGELFDFNEKAASESKKIVEHTYSPEKMEKEKKLQQAVLNMKDKFGKNAVLKGMNLQEGATQIERNNQIGGHKA